MSYNLRCELEKNCNNIKLVDQVSREDHVKSIDIGDISLADHIGGKGIEVLTDTQVDQGSVNRD